MIFEQADTPGQGTGSFPVGGLAYYISAPRSAAEAWADPFRGMFYCAFIMGSCGLFSLLWIDVSGSSPVDVARQLQNQGKRRSGTRMEHCSYRHSDFYDMITL